MDNNYQNIKNDVVKINQRIKEYLWKKWNLLKTTVFKFADVRGQFLAK